MTTDPATAAPTTAEIEIALDYAIRIAVKKTKAGTNLRESARDAATDGVMWALAHYQPEQGKTFGAFSASAVRTWIHRAITRERFRFATAPEMVELHEGFEAPTRTTASAADIALPLAVQELPEELRNVVRLYYIDRFDLRDVGLLLGMTMETARTRLQQAANILAGGQMARRPRSTGSRRIHH